MAQSTYNLGLPIGDLGIGNEEPAIQQDYAQFAPLGNSP